jgi:hypothetical protein
VQASGIDAVSRLGDTALPFLACLFSTEADEKAGVGAGLFKGCPGRHGP